jgi:hypothetical protein
LNSRWWHEDAKRQIEASRRLIAQSRELMRQTEQVVSGRELIGSNNTPAPPVPEKKPSQAKPGVDRGAEGYKQDPTDPARKGMLMSNIPTPEQVAEDRTLGSSTSFSEKSARDPPLIRVVIGGSALLAITVPRRKPVARTPCIIDELQGKELLIAVPLFSVRPNSHILIRGS